MNTGCPRCGRLPGNSHTEICALQGEIERLRHDIERHIAIASELATENERLRAELTELRADDLAAVHLAHDLDGQDRPQRQRRPARAGQEVQLLRQEDRRMRPPTPVGWSDTDWIKHLQEQEGQHPLEGLHINQGSLDAAADAYEAEYNEAQEARRATTETGMNTEEARYRRTVAELQELARNAPHVTHEWVLEVASMGPMEMRRRLIRSNDWHGHFAHSLDGIPEIRNIGGGGIDGCRSHKEVRAIVLDLLRQIDRLKTPNRD